MFINNKVIHETLFFNSIARGIFDFKMPKEEIEDMEKEGISEALMEYLIYLTISKQKKYICNFIIVSPQFLLNPISEERRTLFMSVNVVTKKYIIVPTKIKDSKQWSLVVFENVYMNYSENVFCQHVSDYLKETASDRSNIKVILPKKEKGNCNKIARETVDSLETLLGYDKAKGEIDYNVMKMYFPSEDDSGKEVLSIIQEMLSKENIEKYISAIEPNSAIQIGEEKRYHIPDDLLSSYEARLKSNIEFSDYDMNTDFANSSMNMDSTYIPSRYYSESKPTYPKKYFDTSPKIRLNMANFQNTSLYNPQNEINKTNSLLQSKDSLNHSQSPNQSKIDSDYLANKDPNSNSKKQKIGDLTSILLDKSQSQNSLNSKNQKQSPKVNKLTCIYLNKENFDNSEGFELSPDRTQHLFSNQSKTFNIPTVQKASTTKGIKSITFETPPASMAYNSTLDSNPQQLCSQNTESINNVSLYHTPKIDKSQIKHQYALTENKLQNETPKIDAINKSQYASQSPTLTNCNFRAQSPIYSSHNAKKYNEALANLNRLKKNKNVTFEPNKAKEELKKKLEYPSLQPNQQENSNSEVRVNKSTDLNQCFPENNFQKHLTFSPAHPQMTTSNYSHHKKTNSRTPKNEGNLNINFPSLTVPDYQSENREIGVAQEFSQSFIQKKDLSKYQSPLYSTTKQNKRIQSKSLNQAPNKNEEIELKSKNKPTQYEKKLHNEYPEPQKQSPPLETINETKSTKQNKAQYKDNRPTTIIIQSEISPNEDDNESYSYPKSQREIKRQSKGVIQLEKTEGDDARNTIQQEEDPALSLKSGKDKKENTANIKDETLTREIKEPSVPIYSQKDKTSPHYIKDPSIPIDFNKDETSKYIDETSSNNTKDPSITIRYNENNKNDNRRYEDIDTSNNNNSNHHSNTSSSLSYYNQRMNKVDNIPPLKERTQSIKTGENYKSNAAQENRNEAPPESIDLNEDDFESPLKEESSEQKCPVKPQRKQIKKEEVSSPSHNTPSNVKSNINTQDQNMIDNKRLSQTELIPDTNQSSQLGKKTQLGKSKTSRQTNIKQPKDNLLSKLDNEENIENPTNDRKFKSQSDNDNDNRKINNEVEVKVEDEISDTHECNYRFTNSLPESKNLNELKQKMEDSKSDVDTHLHSKNEKGIINKTPEYDSQSNPFQSGKLAKVEAKNLIKRDNDENKETIGVDSKLRESLQPKPSYILEIIDAYPLSPSRSTSHLQSQPYSSQKMKESNKDNYKAHEHSQTQPIHFLSTPPGENDVNQPQLFIKSKNQYQHGNPSELTNPSNDNASMKTLDIKNQLKKVSNNNKNNQAPSEEDDVYKTCINSELKVISNKICKDESSLDIRDINKNKGIKEIKDQDELENIEAYPSSSSKIISMPKKTNISFGNRSPQIELDQDGIMNNLLKDKVNHKPSPTEETQSNIPFKKCMDEPTKNNNKFIQNNNPSLNDINRLSEVKYNDDNISSPENIPIQRVENADNADNENGEINLSQSEQARMQNPNVNQRAEGKLNNQERQNEARAKPINVNEFYSADTNNKLAVDILEDFQSKNQKMQKQSKDFQGENIIIPVKNKQGRLTECSQQSNDNATEDPYSFDEYNYPNGRTTQYPLSQRANKHYKEKYIDGSGFLKEMAPRKTALAVLNLPNPVLENIHEEDTIVGSKGYNKNNEKQISDRNFDNCEDQCYNCGGKNGECIIV